MEIRITFFIDSLEKVNIIINPIKQKIMCFFIRNSNFSSSLIDTLNIPNIPILIKKRIGKKMKRSKLLFLVRDSNLFISQNFFKWFLKFLPLCSKFLN